MRINSEHLHYDENNKTFSQTIDFNNHPIVFLIDELLPNEKDKALAAVNSVHEWLLGHVDSLKHFAAAAIWEKHKNLPYTVHSATALAEKLPMPNKVYVGIEHPHEVVFDDAVLDEIFGGSCYEIVVLIDKAMQLQNVLLHKYS